MNIIKTLLTIHLIYSLGLSEILIIYIGISFFFLTEHIGLVVKCASVTFSLKKNVIIKLITEFLFLYINLFIFTLGSFWHPLGLIFHNKERKLLYTLLTRLKHTRKKCKCPSTINCCRLKFNGN